MKLNFLQPSVMVAKGKIYFATMTHGCKSVNVIIDKIRSLMKLGLINELRKKVPISFLTLQSEFPECKI